MPAKRPYLDQRFRRPTGLSALLPVDEVYGMKLLEPTPLLKLHELFPYAVEQYRDPIDQNSHHPSQTVFICDNGVLRHSYLQ